MDTITLYEEYRLIERSESEVNGAWKGAHLLLFFLAFVFGSFCTFCFHMLMYLFDEKCVLFPKLLSLTSLRQNIIYEFIPEDKEFADMLPVDFLSTQWVDKSACYLPTYVPLVSGIFGLVWTTMFLMCSTGSRTLTGLQRPWRILLPVFVFSCTMGGLCLYATIITHEGLEELCNKLGEITGSSTCTYSVNVATLAYQRRIRGVYQATRITIASAWLHTLCWLLSALLTVLRVLLVVDFQLVKVRVQLRGNIDKMLEHYEQQIRTVSPEAWVEKEESQKLFKSAKTQSSVRVRFQKRDQTSRLVDTSSLDRIQKSSILAKASNLSLVPDKRNNLEQIKTISKVPKDEKKEEKKFIGKLLYDVIDLIDTPKKEASPYLTRSVAETTSVSKPLARQYGQQDLPSKKSRKQFSDATGNLETAEQIALEIKRTLDQKIYKTINEMQAATVTSKIPTEYKSIKNLTSDVNQALLVNFGGESSEKTTRKPEQTTSDDEPQLPSPDEPKPKKSNLKNKTVQTEEFMKGSSPKVQIITEDNASVLTDAFSEIETEVATGQKKRELHRMLEKEKKD